MRRKKRAKRNHFVPWLLLCLGIFAFLPHCLPVSPDLECSQCPCPEEEGYTCIDSLCIRKENLSLYSTICAATLAERPKRPEPRPEPPKRENPNEAAAEAPKAEGPHDAASEAPEEPVTEGADAGPDTSVEAPLEPMREGADAGTESSVEPSSDARAELLPEKPPSDSSCKPTQEVCNGKDDDCDGQIDEDWPTRGKKCLFDANSCGNVVCKTDGSGVECKTSNETPSAEICNSKDDDCDGQIDEGFKGCVSTLAGSSKGFQDGPGTQAQFDTPTGLVFDRMGNLYVADSLNNRIRKIDQQGNVTTFAGTGTSGFRDGAANSAQFKNPRGLAFDSLGVLFIADEYNHRIRKIDLLGDVSTFTGSGQPGYNDGPVSQARFNTPMAVGFDPAGDLLIADRGNDSIRYITQLQNSPCGNRSSYTGLCITNFAGSQESGFQDGPAKAALLYLPTGVAFDSKGNLFIADSQNYRIRKLDPQGNITTFAGGTPGYADGTGSQARFNNPTDLVIDASDNLYVADRRNHRIRKIDPQGSVTTFAGSSFGHADGPAASAKFNEPMSLIFDAAGNLYVADRRNQRIRKIDKTGNVTTLAGSGTAGFKDGPGIGAQFNDPIGLALDTAGNLYVADSKNHVIRKVDKSGNVGTFAGNGISGFKDGPAASAQFNNPNALIFDAAGNLFVSDPYNSRIRKIDKAGNVTTFAGGSGGGWRDGPPGTARFNNPSGFTFDAAGNLYVADTRNQRIRKVDKAGNVSTVAGISPLGFREGAANSALLNSPNHFIVDPQGNVYVADTSNHSIRKISPVQNATCGNQKQHTGLCVTTLAGTGVRGFKDGPGAQAQFSTPTGLALDKMGNLYVADSLNHRIRKIDPQGNVTTLAGAARGSLDGSLQTARFNRPTGLAIDQVGNLYVSEHGNHRIRIVTPP